MASRMLLTIVFLSMLVFSATSGAASPSPKTGTITDRIFGAAVALQKGFQYTWVVSESGEATLTWERETLRKK
ncbi:MAG: hypothetical protein A2289_09970 [Deltaproteobacteria bacterium RIFOXYA12_FULL_58_15]|nr:MAG: hypothetical protein A2289_09970 [Deltaproteobacteria bacterium RIFOXYA12_FULL_58_15]OGR07323.1 MAG: hypothetical protein A2341_03105 [Deltaproteobacteria bacterium RIFOXYB12_FULL_58_9]